MNLSTSCRTRSIENAITLLHNGNFGATIDIPGQETVRVFLVHVGAVPLQGAEAKAAEAAVWAWEEEVGGAAGSHRGPGVILILILATGTLSSALAPVHGIEAALEEDVAAAGARLDVQLPSYLKILLFKLIILCHFFHACLMLTNLSDLVGPVCPPPCSFRWCQISPRSPQKALSPSGQFLHFARSRVSEAAASSASILVASAVPPWRSR